MNLLLTPHQIRFDTSWPNQKTPSTCVCGASADQRVIITNMKMTALITALAFGLGAATTLAQDTGGRPPRGDRPPPREGGPRGPGSFEREGQRPPPPPIIAALDANHDGMIDATEIANASAALKSLDKNGDGQLTPEELRPPRPEFAPDGARGPRGPEPRGLRRDGPPGSEGTRRPHRTAPEQ